MKYNLSLETEITTDCNLDCIHCYLDKTDYKYMPIWIYKDVISKLASIKDPLTDKKSLIISGGEPLIHPSFKDFIAETNNFEGKIDLLNINTNGLLVPKYIDLFKDHNYRFQISIDGNAKTHDQVRGKGTFKKAKEAIELLNKYDKEIALKMTVYSKNFSAIEDFLNLCIQYNAHPSINYYVETPSHLEQIRYSEYRELIHKYYFLVDRLFVMGPCFAGVTHLSVKPNGEFIDCPLTNNVLGRYPDPLPYDRVKMILGEGSEPICHDKLFRDDS